MAGQAVEYLLLTWLHYACILWCNHIYDIKLSDFW